LLQIEGIGIAEPFQFATGSEIDQALAILNDNTKSDVVTLTRELLASELNFASGNGLVDQQDLHEVLILWGEELVAQGAPAPGAISVTAVRPPSEVGNAAGMFGVLNGSTGGGGTDE
jgi:hypothetical protein